MRLETVKTMILEEVEISFASENTICCDINSYWQFKLVNKWTYK